MGWGGKTIGERFSEERERWEAETGISWLIMPGFSKNVVRAIEGNLGGIYNVKRIEMLLYAEIDVLYVLIGRRTRPRLNGLCAMPIGFLIQISVPRS
jgi:hypothetical protein